MRFVFVSETPDRVRGGIERHCASMVAELGRRGHPAVVVRPEEFRHADARGADWLVFDGIRRLAILRHARRGRAGPGLAVFPHGSFLEEARRRELVAGGHWTPPRGFRWRSLFDRTLGRSVYRRFDRWFVLAETEGRELQRLFGVAPERITVSGPFLSREFLDAVAGAPQAPAGPTTYLCSVSRIERRKNFPRLLEAMSGGPDRFILAGQDRGGLAELQEASRRVPGVAWEYRGTVTEEQKVALLRGARGVVVPSVLEGVPAIALEALAVGRPVVLAGLAYGPDGPGVFRCSPDVADLRRGLEALRGAPPFEPWPPPTVEQAVDGFLKALGGRPAESVGA